MRNMLRMMLEGHPEWQVCAEASNGREAVEKAAELKPDVVILDVSMPVMDGLQAAREILRSSPLMPILLYTTHSFPTLALEAQKIGIQQVLSKPHGPEQLLSAVEALLAEKLRRAEETAQVTKRLGEPA